MARFTAKAVSQIVRIPVGTLNYWISKDQIPGLEAEPTVAGKSRAFFMRDIKKIALYRFLSSNFGLDPKNVTKFWPKGVTGRPNSDFVDIVDDARMGGQDDWYMVIVNGVNFYDAAICFTQSPDPFIESEEKKFPVGSVTKINVSRILAEVEEHNDISSPPGSVIGDPD